MNRIVNRLVVSKLVLVLAALAPFIVCAQNLGSTVNTDGDEYINYIYSDDSGIVFTRRSGNEFVFISKIVADKYLPAIPLNINWYHNNGIGAASFTADGKRMYFVGIEYFEG